MKTNAWQIILTDVSIKKFKKLPKQDTKRIFDYFENRVLKQKNPLTLATQLVGKKPPLWRYRVGSYRIICKAEQNQLIIHVIDIGHRRNVYL